MGAHSLPRELYWVLSSTQLVGHLRFASHWHERAQGHCGYCMYQVCSCLASFSNPCTAAICTPSAPQLPSLSLPKPPRAFSKEDSFPDNPHSGACIRSPPHLPAQPPTFPRAGRPPWADMLGPKAPFLTVLLLCAQSKVTILGQGCRGQGEE